jgi:hypothetical protein
VSLLGVLLWWRWPVQWGKLHQAALLILLALGLRMAFLALPASDDVHRYVWEGQQVLHGLSPYATTADHPPGDAWRDVHWQRMNHKNKLTAYPPLALLLCAGIEGFQGAGVPAALDHTMGFKLAAALADLLLVALLMMAVKELRWVALYAVNPVPLISYAGEGHFDVWMALAMVAGIVWVKRPRLASCCLALGIGIKLIAVLLLPVLWLRTAREQRGHCILIATGILLLPALPFLPGWEGLITGIYRFGSDTSSNATLHWLLELLTGSKGTAAALSLGLAGLWAWHRRVLALPPEAASREALTLLLIAAPTVTYWYVGWALPFAVLPPTLRCGC